MSFTSIVFLVFFLPVVWLVNRFLPKWVSTPFLVLASLLFYLWGEQRFFLLLVCSILLNYAMGLLIERFRGRGRAAFLWMIAAVCCNVGLLFYYKYFFALLGFLGIPTSLRAPGLPLAISFFTFQSLSYVLDVYYGTVPAERNPLNVALYISFFPKLLMGPMTRFATLRQSIESREITLGKTAEGLRRFLLGMAKKLILAGYLGGAADRVFALMPGELSVASAWLGIVFYCLQLFFDLSGYADMAVGLGWMFGFDLPENFRYPYLSTSLSEFWRRWHSTLGEWFRTYVYIPVFRVATRFRNPRSGKRWGTFACDLFALGCVWLLIGLWHGPGMQFMVHGLWQLMWIALERLRQHREKRAKKLGRPGPRRAPGIPGALAGHLYLILVVLVGQVFFRVSTVETGFSYVARMFSFGRAPWADALSLYLFRENLGALVLGLLCCGPVVPMLRARMQRYGWGEKLWGWLQPVVYLLLLGVNLAYLVSGTYQPFIYLNF